MVKFWLVTIGIFLIITYVLHKAVKKFVKGNKLDKKSILNIYHWEVLVALSSGLTYLFLLVLKSTNLLPY